MTGTCPGCHRLHPLTTRGALRVHRIWTATGTLRTCPGSGMRPAVAS